ncbi:MAG: acetyl-CoA carboxylase biotin carboxylase subunit [Acidobacteria bacterium]|nr:MAG: acetyl-CoA carboxylase biotin carboxylase subunit [Acidobacteriota bacterium]
MIHRLLIANRGEIAVRIARACAELAIESVAVFSDADARALHVLVADRAVPLGGSAAIESYLSIPKILAAAQSVGADAIHPGYGFLSESAALATACERSGVVFVGPPSTVMGKMGSKIEARRLVQSAGIPVVPGETPADQSSDGVRRALERLGFPALLKASAGGGGKGMRRVRDGDDVVAHIESARREAHAAFGDGTLYVERLLDAPHHIEVQVCADCAGRAVHLFERECSVQRRHQKVIEESPSPNVTDDLRQRMVSAALRIVEAASYRNVGTIEFLVDSAKGGKDAGFYFLEMNTRLQVEHPVTELVTGVDLVRAQLGVASGEALPWRQADLAQRGHAIEARIYAEDPAANFLPQAGRLLLYREPQMPGVRVDSGVREGIDVGVHYDPLLAKVIAQGETRSQAIARLVQAFRGFPILGIRTNVPLLLAILEHPTFVAGSMHTGSLDAELSALLNQLPTMPPPFVQAAVRHATARGAKDAGRTNASWDPWHRLSWWRS